MALNVSTNVYIPYGGYKINKKLLCKNGAKISGSSYKSTQILYELVDGILFDNEPESLHLAIRDMAISNENLSLVGECDTTNTAVAINYASCIYENFKKLWI